VEESVTYQEIKEEGRDEGRIEGELKGLRKMILILGRTKFGEPPPEVRTALEGIRDLNRLEVLGAQVLGADSWQALLGQT